MFRELFGKLALVRMQRAAQRTSGRTAWRAPRFGVVQLEDRSVPAAGTIFDTDALLISALPPSLSVTNPVSVPAAPLPGTNLPAAALAVLQANAAAAGLLPGDVATPFVANAYADGPSGTSHAYFQQEFNGLPVFNTNVGVHLAPDGSVVALNGRIVPGLSAQESATGAPAPTQTAVQAVAAAAGYFGYALTTPAAVTTTAAGADRTTVLSAPEFSDRPITAKLVYVYTASGVREAWEFNARTPDGDHWFDVAVDAQTGTVVFANDWVDNFLDGGYNVFPLPTRSPDEGAQAVLVNPFDPVASPFGWHDTNGVAGADTTDTTGNNVNAQADLDDTDASTTRPDAGPGLVFNYPLDLTQDPDTYVDAAVTNLFYLNNVIHDLHYKYGFTEAAGNFQGMNYSGQGVGGDAVEADAQDGGNLRDIFHLDNANFATPPDGTPGRMQMYLFDLTSPFRDGDLVADIVIHEYGHGVSNRLTGGPANSNALNALQSGGMGEGWGDFWALMFTQQATDPKLGGYTTGPYVFGNPAGGGGVRRFPYSFSMAVNPQTFADFNGGFPNNEVHNAGELWASTLWDLNWLLIDKYGFDPDLTTGYSAGGGPGSAGNKLALRLVMDGLKLQPANPSFIDARDAILAADRALTGGVNQREIWTAFARRGLGFGASTSNSNSQVVTTSFVVPIATQNPAVIGQAPTGLSRTAPSQITFEFSEAMNTASFSLADVVSFTGPGGANLLSSISGFSWLDSTHLQVRFPVQSAQGKYTMVLAPSILAADTGTQTDQDLDGIPGETVQDRYTGYVQYDAVALTVVSLTPASGISLFAPDDAITVTFSEPPLPTSVTPAFLQLSQGTVTGVTQLSPTSYQFAVTGLVPGNVYTSVKYGAATDAKGFPIQAYNTTLVATTSSVVTGTVFEDFNGDGLFDPQADLGVSGVTTFIDLNGNGVFDGPAEPSAVTDPAGVYVIGTTPGVQTVRVVAPPGNVVVFPASAAYTVDAPNKGSVTGRDFGLARRNSLYGRVTVDQNRSGAFDATEGGLSGRLVYDDVNRNNALDRRPFSASSGPINLAIPDNGPFTGAISTLNIGGVTGVVTGVTVTVNVTHPAVGELLLDLTSPTGQTVTLAANRGGTGANFTGTVFDDTAGVPVSAATAPFTGRVRPDQLLAAFNGTNANGGWTLGLRDTAIGNVGQLDSWSLVVTGSTEATVVTDANGYYRFDGIGAGTHVLEVVPPTDWTNTYPLPAGAVVAQNVVSLPNGQFRQNLDFGQTFNMNLVAPVGPETLVNTFTAGDQQAAAAGADSAGGTVVVWQSAAQDGDGLGVYAQRYNPDGTPNGAEFRVNTSVLGDQSAPAVAVAPSGAFVVAWQAPDADGTGIFAQWFTNTGNRIGGEVQVNTAPAGDQGAPAVAIDTNGNAVVAWESAGQDGSGFGVYAQRFAPGGTKAGGEFRVNTFTANDQRAPAVAATPAGNFVVVWQSTSQEGFPTVPATAGTGVFGQLFTAAGAPTGSEFPVNTTVANNQRSPSVATDGSGNFVVAWQSNGQDGSGDGVFARRFTAAATPVAGEFRVNTYTGNGQASPVVATDGSGNFVVAWQSNGQDRSGYGVYAQRYTAAGTPNGREVRLNTTTPGSQTGPALAVAPAGGFTAAWTGGVQDGSGDGVFAQRFSLASTNRSPNRINLSNLTVAENAGANALVGALSGVDPDGDAITYTLVPGAVDNGQFVIAGTQLKAVGSFDFEARNSYTVRVRATDPAGLFFDRLFTIAVTNVNETPTDVALSNAQLKENAGPNALIGLLAATDPDFPPTAQTYTFTLVPGQADNALFGVFGGNQLRAVGSFDFETKNTYTVLVQVRDQGGLTFQKSFTVGVADVNEAPTSAVLTPNTIAENAGSFAFVGDVTGADPDAGDVLTYSLVPGAGDNALFSLFGTSLFSNQSFDFEARKTYTVVVRTTDAAGLTLDRSLTVTVTNVNEAPTNLTLAGASIAENKPVGTVIGTLTTTDPDAGDTFTYAITGGDAAAFAVVNGQLVSNTPFDFEAKSVYTIAITATDAGGNAITRTFVISILDVAEASPFH